MENQAIKDGLKNSIIVVSTQAISFGLGIAKALVLPILLGVTNFGYWQIYMLYLSYVGVFAFGYNDGIYLRYGKYEYKDLPREIFRSSIKLFVAAQLIIMFLSAVFILFEPDPNKQISILFAVVNIPVAGLTGVLIYILQVTNQFKKYSLYSVIDKIVIMLIIALIYFIKTDNYLVVIAADTFSRVLVLILMVYSCRDLLIGKGCGLKEAFQDIFSNISVGIKLMLANLAGMLVLGFGRFIVERFESVEVYSNYSFAISTINLVLVFISAVGLVIYPTLNRLEEKKYPVYYINLNHIITIMTFGLLIIYFPLKVFINNYMNAYVNIYEYLPVIFAFIFLETKMQIIINPYYKLLRKEKKMLNINFFGFIIAAILILPFYFMLKSVLVVAISTFLAMGFRMYISEKYLKKELNVKGNLNILVESIGIGLFILCAYQSNILAGFLGYALIYCVFLARRIKVIKQFFSYFSKG